ncbi:ROK family transcriptional regulator [Allostreptomyces psammosilenae]|uniref:Putative NBD/HSP70 family sugar kinase n=1 Tax=Allostreptomyces psammosilenae TaxID=1892865 RepID=A0A852ZSR5_9ACTN|nr:ROK family transcriptional regulator [Allostreptomyces psammosilenae]NYI04300.1 putative NBD/HSP70 family sugar kinase [Allostreptomyces psammosilenae]
MSLGQPSAADLIGERTRAEIFALVLTAGPISRTGIADRLGLAPSTVTRLLPPLLAGDYLRETRAVSTGPGRPQRLLRVNADRHVVVGVKIAPTHVAGVLTDMGARVLARAETPLAECSPATALAVAAELVTTLLAEAPTRERALGVGVGVGGHVDSRAGSCRYSAILGWREVDVAGPLAAATGLPVVVDNDVNTLVVAQRWFGGGKDVDSFAVVTVGSGVGCGLLLDGALYSGASGMAGELGHLPLEPDGPTCGCGRRGCLEALASSGAVLRRLRRCPEAADCPDVDAAVALARGDDGPAGRAARAAFAAAGQALGRGLAGLCNLLNLHKIIIAGEGVTAHDLFGPAMMSAFEEHAFSEAARDCRVCYDPVEDDLWARGAACLVIRETVRAPLS